MVNQAVEEKVEYKSYRLTLPKDASPKQRRDFKKQIELLRRLNPTWAVISDWPRPGEKEAYVIVRKGKDYAYRRASYLAKSHLARAITGGYE